MKCSPDILGAYRKQFWVFMNSAQFLWARLADLLSASIQKAMAALQSCFGPKNHSEQGRWEENQEREKQLLDFNC